MVNNGRVIKVLIVEDSVLFQKMLSTMISTDPEVEVVACAKDPYEARNLIKQHKPDVITLDIEMPKMNGIAFLKNLMRLNPIPTIMVSSLTKKRALETLKCLEMGGVDFVLKQNISGDNLDEFQRDILKSIKCAASANVEKVDKSEENDALPAAKSINVKRYKDNKAVDKWLIAVGSSTGGISALETFLSSYNEYMPSVMIVQHIPETFSQSMADRFNKMFPFNVHHIENDMLIEKGNVYIAKGNRHLLVKSSGGRFVCKTSNTDPLNGHRPSVSALFDSLSVLNPDYIISVMLTGMGNDGADAMKKLHDLGSYSLAQDKETSVVWGMPKSAIDAGGVNKVLPIHLIMQDIHAYLAANL